jgi:hypothetical protein
MGSVLHIFFRIESEPIHERGIPGCECQSRWETIYWVFDAVGRVCVGDAGSERTENRAEPHSGRGEVAEWRVEESVEQYEIANSKVTAINKNFVRYNEWKKKPELRISPNLSNLPQLDPEHRGARKPIEHSSWDTWENRTSFKYTDTYLRTTCSRTKSIRTSRSRTALITST